MRRLLLLLALLAVPAHAAGPEVVVAVTRMPGPEVLLADEAGTVRARFPGGSPSWSPDGSRLAYVADRAIWVARADGTDRRALTSGANDGDPAWSRDGTRIAFRRTVGTAEDIWLVNPDGTGATPLSSDGGTKTAPQWAPAGSRLAWVRRGNGTQVFVADVPGAVRAITAAGGLDTSMSWSPDGTQLAIICEVRVCLVRADGSDRRLLSPASTFATDPAWSPDGTRVAFTLRRVFPELGSRYGPATRDDVAVATLAGVITRLTGPLDEGYAGAGGGGTAGWSPDARQVTFTGRDGSSWSMRPDGRCERRLVPDATTDSRTFAPAWRPGVVLTPPAGCVDLRVFVRTANYEIGVRQQSIVTLTIENDGTLPATGVVGMVGPERGRAAVLSWPAAVQPGAAGAGQVSLGPASVGPLRAEISTTLAEVDSDPTSNRTVIGVDVLDCHYAGGPGSDVMAGTRGPDRLCGRSGSDRITGGAGADVLDGGSGYDTIEGGSGRDRIFGGGERDVILARDGERDVIDCGGMRDTAIIDRLDSVTGCERVLRR